MVDLSSNWESASQIDKKQIFTVHLVSTPEELVNQWNPVFEQVFTDENDREPIETLLERLSNGEKFFMMRNSHGDVVGIELPQIMQGSTAMYIPWTGVLEEYRNLGIGTIMNSTISNYMKNNFGVTHTLLDIEDPDRLHTSAYDPEEMPEAIELAARRVNYWRRVGDGTGVNGGGFVVVNDTTLPTGQKLEYVRPASDDNNKIQAYDHMCIRFDDKSLISEHMNPEQTAVSRDFVRQCYLDMNRLQYGDISEAELRGTFPAINQYLTDIDNISSEFLPIDTTPIVQKSSPRLDVEVVMVPPEQPRARDLQLGPAIQMRGLG
jgi:hypothetical protein